MIDLVDNQPAAPLLDLLYSMTTVWVAISAKIIVSLLLGTSVLLLVCASVFYFRGNGTPQNRSICGIVEPSLSVFAQTCLANEPQKEQDSCSWLLCSHERLSYQAGSATEVCGKRTFFDTVRKI